jgi:hypothetical protein
LNNRSHRSTHDSISAVRSPTWVTLSGEITVILLLRVLAFCSKTI